ncbi:membrane protein [Petrotoga halophila DSM 16923]|uniref:Membrane protein n=2 Tax=Petrotoga TaxID=28236 RepID=A0A2S5E9N5_9BACT|nr:membrane protein [Petrotoga halophila DSM 16923]
MRTIAVIFITLGILFVIIGLMFAFNIKLGRLPGDIIIKRENFVLYIPITTMLIVSGIITLLSIIIRRFF